MDELEEEEAFLHVELNEISSNCATVKNKLEDIISERKSKKTKNLDKIERMSHLVSITIRLSIFKIYKDTKLTFFR